MIDFWNEWALAHGAPAGWHWRTLAVIENSGPKRYDRLTGAVYSTLLKSGPRKGKWNVRKPDPGTLREFIIDHDEWLRWREEYLKTRGLCVECAGEGRLITGCGVETGTRYKPCPLNCAAAATAVLFEPPAGAPFPAAVGLAGQELLPW